MNRKEIKMIRFEANKEGDCNLAISGTTQELAVESLAFISSVRRAIDEKDKIAGCMYAITILKGIDYAVMTDEEKDRYDKRMAKKKKEKDTDEKFLEELTKLRNTLEDLKKGLEVEDSCQDIRSADFDSEDEFMKWFRNDSNKEDE